MDPIEERDLEKVLKLLDDEQVKKKVIAIIISAIESGKVKLNMELGSLISSENFRIGIKSIIAEFNDEMKEANEKAKEVKDGDARDGGAAPGKQDLPDQPPDQK